MGRGAVKGKYMNYIRQMDRKPRDRHVTPGWHLFINDRVQIVGEQHADHGKIGRVLFTDPTTKRVLVENCNMVRFSIYITK
jgi:hypothetical protein